jgi:hypothetical protein
MGKQYQIDSRKAKDAVYAAKGEGPCPYDEGTRIARLWAKWKTRFCDMEAQADEMATVYGEYRPDKLKAKERCDG